MGRENERHSHGKVAGDVRAARPSRLMIAAAAPRRHVCLGRRHAAPHRLAAAGSTSGSSERSESSTNSAMIESQSAEETPATSVPATVVTVVGLAGLYSSTSNAGQCEGCAAASSAAAGDDMRQGKVDAAQRAARRGEAECAPEAVAAAVPPLAKDVLRHPLRPQPATGESLERERSAHTVGTNRVRVERSTLCWSMDDAPT